MPTTFIPSLTLNVGDTSTSPIFAPPAVTIINPPHTAIGSRIPDDQLPPLGLLYIGGALLDIGCAVQLIDSDLTNDKLPVIVQKVVQRHQHIFSTSNEDSSTLPHLIMLGHSGSSTVHETVVELCQQLKHALPDCLIVYGGVYPTYHYDEIMANHGDIDVIIRGEGEKTIQALVTALQANQDLRQVAGIVYRDGLQQRLSQLANSEKVQSNLSHNNFSQANFSQEIIINEPASLIQNLDDYRVGWELIDFANYSYWGGKRAVVVQFSRGCPYLCNYCGQRGFWTRWRHRDPKKFAQELVWLHRTHGVEVINFADELPTGSKKKWKAFLEALIAEDVPLLLVGSTRAGDIVRDREHLHLYKKAGVIRFLLGIESYDEATIHNIQKNATISEDRLAIKLLQQHGIIAMATYVVGFENEKDIDFWRSFRHLLSYDPDQIQLLYATPHRWTPFYDKVGERRVILADTRRWDYKHQVFLLPHVPAWRVFLWFKLIEVCLQARPKAVGRMLFHRLPEYRQAMRWYSQMGKRVWFSEVFEFIFKTKHLKNPPTLNEFFGKSLSEREYALQIKKGDKLQKLTTDLG